MNDIIICDDCRIPLIWTFHWAYYEYYCLNCGGHWGMLGAGERVKATPELKRKLRKLTKLWRSIAIRINPFSKYTKSDCKKCRLENDHRLHLRKKEKIEHKAVIKILENLKGVLA